VGTFHYKNQFAAFMELMAPIALWRILYRNPVAGAICYAAMLGATLTSTSRTGLVLIAAELVGFLLMVLLGRRAHSDAVLRVGILVVFAAGAAVVAGTQQTTVRFEQDPSADVRAPLNASTIRMVRERPWFGFGMGTWPAAYQRFATFDMALIANEGHDDWLQWASEGGVPFALLMAALALWLTKPAVRSLWGLGLLVVLVHSAADYLLRDPALGFAWFGLAGAVSRSARVLESGTE
jgi:O-antigen ligase